MELLHRLIETPSPSGEEGLVQRIILDELDGGCVIDSKGNIWVAVLVENDSPSVLFTAHMDCVHSITSVDDDKVLFEVDDKGIMSLAPKSNQTALGADDKAGIRVLLHMIKAGVEGLYCFTVEEEVGCIGAEHAATLCPPSIKHAITFDRREKHSIITKMSGTPCCSDAFAEYLIEEFKEAGLRYVKDPTGSTTDTNMFKHKTLNHTNISIGYRDEHSRFETLDTKHVQAVMEAVVQINWNGLPEEERPAPAPVYTLPRRTAAYVAPPKTSDVDAAIETATSFQDGIDALRSMMKGCTYIAPATVEYMLLAIEDLYDLTTCYEEEPHEQMQSLQ